MVLPKVAALHLQSIAEELVIEGCMVGKGHEEIYM
jgi:hypothetical protein